MIVLGIGIYSVIVNGNSLRIEKNSNYRIQYNTKLSEYYLIVNTDETELNLYVPKETNNMSVYHLNKNNEIIKKTSYTDDSKIILETNTTEEDFYLIEAEYSNEIKESLKLYIYKEEE